MKNTIKTAMALALITTTYAMDDEVDYDSFTPTVEVKKAASGTQPNGSIAVPSLASLKLGGLGKPAFKIKPLVTKPAGELFDPVTHIAKADINSSHAEYRPVADVVPPSSYVLKTEIDESADGSGSQTYVLRTAKQIVDDALVVQGKDLKQYKTKQAVHTKALDIVVNHNAESLAAVAQLLGIELETGKAESVQNYHTPTTADNYVERIDALKGSAGFGGTWADDVAEGYKNLLSHFVITVSDLETKALVALQLEKAARTYGLVLDGREDGDAMIAKFDNWAAANNSEAGVSDGSAKARFIALLEQNGIAHS